MLENGQGKRIHINSHGGGDDGWDDDDDDDQ